jgi:hypothetical protein
MQRKLAMCQRRKGRTWRNSHRISEGIHEIMLVRAQLAEMKDHSSGRRSRLPHDQNGFHTLLKVFAIPTSRKTRQQLTTMDLYNNRGARSEFNHAPLTKPEVSIDHLWDSPPSSRSFGSSPERLGKPERITSAMLTYQD